MPQTTIGKLTFEVDNNPTGDKLLIDGTEHSVDLFEVSPGRFNMIIDGKSRMIEVVEREEKEAILKVDGQIVELGIKNETDLLLERLGMNISSKKEVKELKAPMPGLVLDILVSPGDDISEGDALIVLEAMKMENILKAPSVAKVKSIEVEKGQALDKNAILIKFE